MCWVILTFRISSVSDGLAETMRSLAIRAKARQLFVICHTGYTIIYLNTYVLLQTAHYSQLGYENQSAASHRSRPEVDEDAVQVHV